MIIKYYSCYILLSLFTISVSSYSQELTEITPLYLGKIVVFDNSTVSTIKITKDGLARRTGGIHFIETGEPATFDVSDFQANRRLYITVSAIQSGTTTSNVSPEQFTVTGFEHDDYVVTDSNGDASFKVGGTFETSGSSSENFRDTVYSANYRVIVNY